MKPFLQDVAEDIYSKYANNLRDVCLVFPNRRSILYFNKYLSQLVSKPVWAPQTVTISSFFENFAALKKADDLVVLFELHKIYCEVRNVTETFDTFYFWGELMLSDFNDIDKYLIRPDDLFKNLAALKNIDDQFEYLTEDQLKIIKQFWQHFEASKNSEHHQEFSDVWSCMLQIYNILNNNLRQQGIAYEGMIYKGIATIIANNSMPENTYSKVAFVGFNALNECEAALFRHYKKNEMALFYWDYELEFVTNPIHEAGFFIRKNIVEFPSAIHYNESSSPPPSIKLTGIPSATGQTKYAAQTALSLLSANNDPEHTAVLLTEENLLPSVLHAISPKIDNINITMGFPLRNAPIVSLIESIGKLHLFGKRATKETRETAFYYKYVLTVLNHPYIHKYDTENVLSIRRHIVKANLNYLYPQPLLKNELLTLCFSGVTDSVSYLKRIANIISHIGNNNSLHNHTSEQPVGIENESLIVAFQCVQKFYELLAKQHITIDLPLCNRILIKLLKNETIPFEGEPLKGLQIMGFLESRALDFKNLIVIGVNEGNLPKTNIPASFIPHNLRRGYGMPTMEYRDAMYAYYFHRLLHRAENVHLIYNTKPDRMGASELSRYALQLCYNPRYEVGRFTQTSNIQIFNKKFIAIQKDETVHAKLRLYTKATDSENQRYLSPSALTSYLNCKLQFYFHYVEKLREPDEPLEDIDAPMLGNILHKAMYLLYSEFQNQWIDNQRFTILLEHNDRIDNALRQAIVSEYMAEKQQQSLVLEGRNIIIYKILYKYIRQIIKTDRSFAPIFFKGLEYNIATSVKIGSNEVNLGGIIDRIDETAAAVRIIDYKTGNADKDASSVASLFDSENENGIKKEVFQTLLYAMLYNKQATLNKPLVPGIFKIRDIFNDNFQINIDIDKQNISDIARVEDEFYGKTIDLLTEIFNADVAFDQTKVTKRCQFCNYASICER